MSALGLVPRPYDVAGNYERGFRQPLHRLDDGLAHMRVDGNGELLVQAHCRRHYVMQSQADLFAGRLARCITEGCRWR